MPWLSTSIARQNVRLLDRLRVQQMTSMSSARTQSISVPRPSASLVIVNRFNQVLLVHRNPQATSFAGVHVSACFPGQATNTLKLFAGFSRWKL